MREAVGSLGRADGAWTTMSPASLRISGSSTWVPSEYRLAHGHGVGSGGNDMRHILLLAFFAMLPTAGSSQILEDGTYDVYVQEISAEGRLEGCSLVFTTITTDTAYLRGAQVLLNGSIALRTLGAKDLLFTAKLGTRQILPNGPGAWEPPTHFHFYTKTGTTAGRAKITESDTPGYRLLIGRATDPEIFNLVMEMADAGELRVGFNRKAGGQDVTAPIKMNVALGKDATGTMRRVLNPQTPKAYADCVSRLTDSLLRQLGK